MSKVKFALGTKDKGSKSKLDENGNRNKVEIPEGLPGKYLEMMRKPSNKNKEEGMAIRRQSHALEAQARRACKAAKRKSLQTSEDIDEVG